MVTNGRRERERGNTNEKQTQTANGERREKNAEKGVVAQRHSRHHDKQTNQTRSPPQRKEGKTTQKKTAEERRAA